MEKQRQAMQESMEKQRQAMQKSHEEMIKSRQAEWDNRYGVATAPVAATK